MNHREAIMTVDDDLSGVVPIKSEADIVNVRKAARMVAEAMSFGITDITRIVTAASELARNIVLYARPGIMEWHRLGASGSIGIELKFEDHGPGIPDIEQAMQPGYSTGGGLGLGLPGSKRLMDEMEIKSEIGKGTIVTVRKYLKRQQNAITERANSRGAASH